MNIFERDKFALRPASEQDSEQILKWRNDERIRENMYNNHIISPEEHSAWFARMLQSKTDKYFVFEIEGRPCGVVAFNRIDRINKKSEWAFYMGVTDAPRGTGSVMEFLALEYAFSTLELHKLNCEVISFNEGVVRLHKKFSFEEEGYFKDEIYRNDSYHGIHRLALYEDIWRAKRNEMKQKLFG